MPSREVRRGVAASVVMVLTVAVAVLTVAMAGPVRPAAGTRSTSVIFAVYNGQNTAAEVFNTMRSAQAATGERILSYAVVSKDPKGKVAAGGAIGYLTGAAVGIPHDKVKSMERSLMPDSSAVVVALDDRWVQDVERDLRQAQARQVIANQIGNK